MAWEGHTRTELDREKRQPMIEAALALLAESAVRCREAGLPAEIVSAGGTGTFEVTAYQPEVTEIQAGGAILGDVASQQWQVGTAPCLFVRATVTSRPAPDRIVIDAGFKALPAWHSTPQAVGLSDVVGLRMSAAHGVVRLSHPNHGVQVGEALDFLVGYGDETVCLHRRLYGVRDGRVEVEWSIP
jgi:D-serine deaminase-like pyridoxal phosphate-dependent protein